MELNEWTIRYIRFKDCMKKKIVSISSEENKINVKEKNQRITYLLQPEIHTISSSNNKTIIVTYNTPNNLKYLQNHWEEFTKNTSTSIIFVNTQTNEQWHIHPHHHNKIADKIDKSLQTLHESITIQ